MPLISLAILPSNASKIAANKISVTAKLKFSSIENLIELIDEVKFINSYSFVQKDCL